MKSVFCFLFAVACSAALAGEEKSVLAPTPAEPVAVQSSEACRGRCCRLYNEKVSEEESCRRTLRGGYVKRQVVRKVYTPVR